MHEETGRSILDAIAVPASCLDRVTFEERVMMTRQGVDRAGEAA